MALGASGLPWRCASRAPSVNAPAAPGGVGGAAAGRGLSRAPGSSQGTGPASEDLGANLGATGEPVGGDGRTSIIGRFARGFEDCPELAVQVDGQPLTVAEGDFGAYVEKGPRGARFRSSSPAGPTSRPSR
jgi:hypothetical protein